MLKGSSFSLRVPGQLPVNHAQNQGLQLVLRRCGFGILQPEGSRCDSQPQVERDRSQGGLLSPQDFPKDTTSNRHWNLDDEKQTVISQMVEMKLAAVEQKWGFAVLSWWS